MRLHPSIAYHMSTKSDINSFLGVLNEFARKVLNENSATRGSRRCIIELGTRGGSSTIAFLSAIHDYGYHDATLHSCDIAPCGNAKKNISKYGLMKYWKFYQVDSIVFASRFEDDSLPLVFIDTSHEYDQTVAEIQAWKNKLVKHGYMIFHDTMSFQNGVAKPILEFMSSDDGNMWEYNNIECGAGLGILKRI